MHVVLIDPTVKYNQYCGEVTTLYKKRGGATTLGRLHCNIPKLSECESISIKKVIAYMGSGAVSFQVTRFKRLGGPRRSWEDNVKLNFKKWDGVAWTALIWLRVGTGGGRL